MATRRRNNCKIEKRQLYKVSKLKRGWLILEWSKSLEKQWKLQVSEFIRITKRSMITDFKNWTRKRQRS